MSRKRSTTAVKVAQPVDLSRPLSIPRTIGGKRRTNKEVAHIRTLNARDQALRNEFDTDPKGLGYAPLRIAGSDGPMAALINSTYAGIGTVYRNDLSSAEILGALVDSEVAAWTQLQVTWLQVLLAPGRVDASNPRIRNMFVRIIGAGTTSLANVDAAAKVVAPSRAVELLGAGTVVGVTDVARVYGRMT